VLFFPIFGFHKYFVIEASEDQRDFSETTRGMRCFHITHVNLETLEESLVAITSESERSPLRVG